MIPASVPRSHGPGARHRVLPAVRAVAHGRHLFARRKMILPQLLAGRHIAGAHVTIEAGHRGRERIGEQTAAGQKRRPQAPLRSADRAGPAPLRGRRPRESICYKAGVPRTFDIIMQSRR